MNPTDSEQETRPPSIRINAETIKIEKNLFEPVRFTASTKSGKLHRNNILLAGCSAVRFPTKRQKLKNDAVVRSVRFTASFVLSICFYGKCKLNAICIFFSLHLRCIYAMLHGVPFMQRLMRKLMLLLVWEIFAIFKFNASRLAGTRHMFLFVQPPLWHRSPRSSRERKKMLDAQWMNDGQYPSRFWAPTSIVSLSKHRMSHELLSNSISTEFRYFSKIVCVFFLVFSKD